MPTVPIPRSLLCKSQSVARKQGATTERFHSVQLNFDAHNRANHSTSKHRHAVLGHPRLDTSAPVACPPAAQPRRTHTSNHCQLLTYTNLAAGMCIHHHTDSCKLQARSLSQSQSARELVAILLRYAVRTVGTGRVSPLCELAASGQVQCRHCLKYEIVLRLSSLYDLVPIAVSSSLRCASRTIVNILAAS